MEDSQRPRLEQRQADGSMGGSVSIAISILYLDLYLYLYL